MELVTQYNLLFTTHLRKTEVVPHSKSLHSNGLLIQTFVAEEGNYRLMVSLNMEFLANQEVFKSFSCPSHTESLLLNSRCIHTRFPFS